MQEEAALLDQATKAVELAEEEQTREALKSAYVLLENISGDTTELNERLAAVEEVILATEKIEDATLELEAAEDNPTRIRLDRAEKKLLELDELAEEVEARLETVRQVVETEEALVLVAEQALETAEDNPTRDNYESAASALSNVSGSTSALTNRLNTIEEKVVALEEQAQHEAEEARQLQAEADRKAQEQAEDSTRQSSSNSSNDQTTSENTSQSAEEQMVNFLNNASSAELQTIHYVGPAYADRIIEYRNSIGGFTYSSQVKNVSGIADVAYQDLRRMFGTD